MIITPGGDRPCTDLANPREVREFVASKRLRREMIRAVVKGVAAAEFVPRSPAAATDYLARLAELPHWGEHLRQIGELARAFKRLHERGLPTPKTILLNPDVSLTLMFRRHFLPQDPRREQRLTIRVYEKGAVVIIGGSTGSSSRALLAPEVLHALSLFT